MKPRKTSHRIIGMIIGITTGLLAFIFVREMNYPNTKPTSTNVQTIVAEINKTAPAMVNNNTRFDSITITNNTLQYTYTLLNTNSDSVINHQLEQQQKATLINNIKTKESLQFIRNNRLIATYCYYNEGGELFSKITITPDMYQ